MVREIVIYSETEEPDAVYIEGRVDDMWKTPLGHLNLKIVDYSYLKNYDGNIVE